MPIDINSDMGESFGRYQLGNDAGLMPWLTSVNIACGMHAGDPLVMDATLKMAKEPSLAIGAHPAYPDLQGFGRRVLEMTPEEVEAYTLYQIGALAAFAKANGAELAHVKPHGALYNKAASEMATAAAIARAVLRFDSDLILVGLAGSLLIKAGTEAGLRVANEGFPERGYNPDGTLMSRKQAGAVIHDPAEAAANALRLANEGITISLGGETRHTRVDSLCIHGDLPNALNVAQAVFTALTEHQVEIKPLQAFIG